MENRNPDMISVDEYKQMLEKDLSSYIAAEIRKQNEDIETFHQELKELFVSKEIIFFIFIILILVVSIANRSTLLIFLSFVLAILWFPKFTLPTIKKISELHDAINTAKMKKQNAKENCINRIDTKTKLYKNVKAIFETCEVPAQNINNYVIAKNINTGSGSISTHDRDKVEMPIQNIIDVVYSDGDTLSAIKDCIDKVGETNVKLSELSEALGKGINSKDGRDKASDILGKSASWLTIISFLNMLLEHFLF